jgi:catechol 2,3-dioxygenase-like lactoylglutathione lyase family enzyme
MRIQLALNVSDLDEAVLFYSDLFGVQPHKVRPHYANFAIDSPPLKLVLFENPTAEERLNHLGIEVNKSEQLDVAEKRLSAGKILDQKEDGTTCCHAKQDKLWSQDPQGLRWEWYRITDDSPQLTAELPDCCVGL